MSISSYTTVTMLDSRPARITISVPKSTDITNRIITFKDLYGSSSNSTIVLVTRSGDTFEDGTFSTIISNAYQTVNLYAGLPGKWLNVGATGGGGGDSAGLTTVSNNLTTVSNTVAAARFPFISTNTLSTNQINSSNICNAGWISNNGVFSNITAGAFFQNTSNTGTLGVAGLATMTSISNSGVISTLGLNVGSLSSINISTVNIAAGFISTINFGAARAYITNLFVGTEDFGSDLTATSNITQTGGTTILNGLSVSRISTNFIVASNISVTTMSTSYGFFSTISTGSVFGRHIGDGSLLTNLPIARIPSTLSTLAFFTSSISTTNITSPQGYISSLVVDSLAFSFSNSFIVMGDIITTSVSTIQTFTSTLTTNNLRVGTVSSLSFISFPGLQQGYAQTALAEQSTGTGLQELLVFRGSSASDRIRMQTTGSIVFEPGVSARVFPAVGSNVTPAMIINASSNVGIGTATPGVTLDVVGAGRFTAVSTNTISTNQISSGSISNSGMISSLGLNVGALSSINISTVNLAAGFISTINLGATRAYITNLFVGTEDFGSVLTASSNITQTGGTTVLAGLSVNTISTNNISSYSMAANEGFFSNLSAEGFGSIGGYISTFFADSISTITINTDTLTVGGTLYGRLPISTNNTTLTDPASIIIKTPNTSYFYEDYTNLTNYITISNYGAQNGDYINIVNTGNSGAPATFQVLDGSTGVSSIIRYIYPGHAGVVAYSGSQWWPL